MNKSGGDYR